MKAKIESMIEEIDYAANHGFPFANPFVYPLMLVFSVITLFEKAFSSLRAKF